VLLLARISWLWMYSLLTFFWKSMNTLRIKSISRWHCCRWRWNENQYRWRMNIGESLQCLGLGCERFTAMRALSFPLLDYEWFLRLNERDHRKTALNCTAFESRLLSMES
jgi:hypothetical protein